MLTKAPSFVHTKSMPSHNRFLILFLFLYGGTALIILRLFYLQVWMHDHYEAIAEREQYGYTMLPARRGDILVSDYPSGEEYTLATNTTLSMIYADPSMIAEKSDPAMIADTLAPLLFDLKEAQNLDEIRLEDEREIALKIENEELREKALSELKLKNEEELQKEYRDQLEETLATRTREVILYAENLSQSLQEKVRSARLQGAELTENGNLYLYPAKIVDKTTTAQSLGEIFGTTEKKAIDQIESTLAGKNRYVELKHRIDPTVSETIEKILEEDRAAAKIAKRDPYFLGIRLKDEYFRYYPEQEMASQLLGYVGSEGEGYYGIEGTFNEILKGKDGIFASQLDANGNQITVGESTIEKAIDGAKITLTIDRAIQSEVEKLLVGDHVSGFYNARPDSAQAIVIEAKTGAILAMAQYPNFNPNSFGEVYQKVEIQIPEEKKDRIILKGSEENPEYWYYQELAPEFKYQIFPDLEAKKRGEERWLAYENTVGPEVYKNKMIQEFYEPGSVFKPLVAGAAIDAGEITPNSTFNDTGPIPVDFNVITQKHDHTIHTFNDQYHGIETMTQVLEHSCNTGMTYIVRKLGGPLFYAYLKSYGFLERTNIGLNDEVLGTVEYYTNWTESEMATKAFGQGLTITPVQLAQAYTAIANNGTMMQPYLIKSIEYADGEIEEFKPTIVRQVLSADAADKTVAMMTDVVESYASIAIPDHYFAGKSGTAQTYKNGQALKGAGTTIATFIGIGPIEEPEFVVIVKMDKPKSVEWAEPTSGQVLKRIMAFLFDYYSIPPDKTE